MQLKPAETMSLFSSFCAIFVVFSAVFMTKVSADEVSGTWTGSVETRGNYYWEESTRVVAPEMTLELSSPEGLELEVGYLVDVITSASIAAGALEDVRFNEVRHDVRTGIGKEIDLGDKQVHVEGGIRISKEPDYLSTSASFKAALSLNQRNTVLHFSSSLLHDEVRQNFRGGSGIDPDPGGGTSADAFAESFNALSLGIAWEQILSPLWTSELGYDLAWLKGFLANPYRTVAGGARPEAHPNTRNRHTFRLKLARYLPATKTAIHFLLRAYIDSWEVKAIDPEVRFYQEIKRHVIARLRYRYYAQSSSFFYKADQSLYTLADRFVTDDPKMSRFHKHELGLQFVIFFDFIEAAGLRWLSDASLDIGFDYLWNTNRFGNGVIAELGLRVPF